MNVQEKSNAELGQGSGKHKLNPRRLIVKNATTPNEPSLTKENPFLYMGIVTPEQVQYSRVVFQIRGSESPNIPISTQLNQEINPTMENKSVRGGDRIII